MAVIWVEDEIVFSRVGDSRRLIVQLPLYKLLSKPPPTTHSRRHDERPSFEMYTQYQPIDIIPHAMKLPEQINTSPFARPAPGLADCYIAAAALPFYVIQLVIFQHHSYSSGQPGGKDLAAHPRTHLHHPLEKSKPENSLNYANKYMLAC